MTAFSQRMTTFDMIGRNDGTPSSPTFVFGRAAASPAIVHSGATPSCGGAPRHLTDIERTNEAKTTPCRNLTGLVICRFHPRSPRRRRDVRPSRRRVISRGLTPFDAMVIEIAILSILQRLAAEGKKNGNLLTPILTSGGTTELHSSWSGSPDKGARYYTPSAERSENTRGGASRGVAGD